jgi:hypothetical protein
MSRAQIILLSVFGLFVIVVVYGFIRAAGGGEEPEPQTNTMTDVPEKYTYQEMMKGGDKERGFPVDAMEPTGTVEKTPAVDPATTAGSVPEPAVKDAPEISAALADIKETRSQLKKAAAAQPAGDAAAEDDIIRKIVADHPTPAPAQPSSRTIPETAPAKPAGFNTLNFGTSAGNPSGKARTTAVKGVVLNNVEVATGSTVRIMLMENAIVNDVPLNKTMIVTGNISVEDTRVMIHVPGAAINGQLAAIAFSAYGMDGIEGLRIEGNRSEATKQAAKEEIERNIDQAAGGGILGGVVRVVRTLGSGSRTQEMVKIPSGSKIILKIEAE